jgi:threonyl-tRNA synthetase
MGSFERFIGMLIEHYAGEFPVWLAPVQAIVLPVSDRHVEPADIVQAALGDFRVEVDRRTESIGRKIRDAELRKIPYMLVLGDREVESDTLSVRRHREGDQGALSLEDLRAKLAAGD